MAWAGATAASLLKTADWSGARILVAAVGATDDLLPEFFVPDFKIANKSGEAVTESSAREGPLALMTADLDEEAETLPAAPPVAAADFLFPEFNIAKRSDGGTEGADCLLPLTADLTVGILAVTESGGARGAIDNTRGDELALEAEGALMGFDVSRTGVWDITLA